MAQLCIPGDLDFETVQVLELLARRIAERRRAGTRITKPSATAIETAMDLVIGPANLHRIGSPYWRRAPAVTFDRLIDMLAVSLETADAVARTLETVPSSPALPTIAEVGR